jgi:4-hydroxy-tetrahydrodipicolinate synthase
VTSNVAPALCAEMHDAWAARDLDRASEINDLLLPLHEALFCETSPGPVKYAASLLGLCSAEARLPICEIAEATKRRVEDVMVSLGILDKAKAAKAG